MFPVLWECLTYSYWLSIVTKKKKILSFVIDQSQRYSASCVCVCVNIVSIIMTTNYITWIKEEELTANFLIEIGAADPDCNCIKGCGMGTLFVLVSHCLRENVVFTCKIGSFLCSLDNLLQKNVIVLFFLEIKFQNGAHLKKGLFLTYFPHFLVPRESYQNSCSTYLTHIHTCILLTLLTFFALPSLKKIWSMIRYGFSLVWFLVLILIRASLDQSINNKMVSKT